MTRYYGDAATPPTGTGTLTFGTPSTVTSDAKVNGAPSICRMVGGSLLMAYHKLPSDTTGTTSKVVGRISSNDGATWAAEFDIATDGSNSCINPGVITLASGRVLCMFNLYDGATTPADAVRITYSDDNGSTWSSHYTVNSSFTGACASGTTRPIQLANGNVLISVYGGNTGYTYLSSQLFVSTDDGATFGGEVTIASGPTDSRQYAEPAMVLLANGTTIKTNLRTTVSGTTGTIYTNASTDSGATFGATSAAFSGLSDTNVYRRPSTGTWIACVRQNTTEYFDVQTSIDNGVTYVDQGLADPATDLFYYGCAIDKLDGDILIVYAMHTGANVAIIKQLTATETLA